MSCPQEWWIASYVDDGLEAAEARRLEAHLVACERCRGHVLALREEARALAGALTGDGAAPAAAVARLAPARGVAYGLPLAVGLAALATAASSALIHMRLPYDMVFDTLFLLRDRAPGWLQLGVALGALAGLAAVFTFLAGALLRRYAGAGVLVALVGAVVLGGAGAARALPRFGHQDTIRVAEGERYPGTLVVSCESLEIDGVVVGDVLAFCERVAIRGEVDGTVIVVGHEVDVPGRVAGGLIAVAHRLAVDGAVGANAYGVGASVQVGPNGRVAHDAFLSGESVRVEGGVARDLTTFCDHLELAGEVGRDLEGRAQRIQLGGRARVGGDLRAYLPAREALALDPGAVIAGTSDVQLVDGRGHTLWSQYRQGHFYAWVAIGFAASFLIGLILHAVAPSWFAGRIETGREFFASLGRGCAFAVLGPLALALLALTIVGIPAALIGLAAWGACLYLGAVVVAALIGRSLVHPRGEGTREFGMALAVGLAVVVVLRNLPFVGGAAGWVIALVGVGVLVSQAHAAWRRSRPVPA